MDAHGEGVAHLAAINEVTRAILTAVPTELVLGLIAERARRLVGGSVATITTLAADPRLLVVRAASGAQDTRLRGATFPLDPSPSGDVMRTGATLRVDARSCDDWTARLPLGMDGSDQLVLAPLAAPQRTLGVLCVGNPGDATPFTAADEAVVGHFAAEAAIAVDHVRSQSESGRIMVLEEHERIARDLHDGVIQSLFALGMSLRTTASMIDQPGLARGRLGAALDHLDEVISDIRAYIFGLKPQLVASSLEDAIRGLLRDVEMRTAITAVLDADPSAIRLLEPHATELLHILREALSNVERHAQALTCRVSIHRDRGTTAVVIDDDGVGFDPSHVPKTGLGLSNLAHRAASINGRFEVAADIGTGTTLRIVLPIDSNDGEVSGSALAARHLVARHHRGEFSPSR